MVTSVPNPELTGLLKSQFCFLVSVYRARWSTMQKGSVVAIERAITGSILSYRFAQYCFTQELG